MARSQLQQLLLLFANNECQLEGQFGGELGATCLARTIDVRLELRTIKQDDLLLSAGAQILDYLKTELTQRIEEKCLPAMQRDRSIDHSVIHLDGFFCCG